MNHLHRHLADTYGQTSIQCTTIVVTPNHIGVLTKKNEIVLDNGRRLAPLSGTGDRLVDDHTLTWDDLVIIANGAAYGCPVKYVRYELDKITFPNCLAEKGHYDDGDEGHHASICHLVNIENFLHLWRDDYEYNRFNSLVNAFLLAYEFADDLRS